MELMKNKKSLKLTLVVPNYRWNEGDQHTFWIYAPYGLCCLAAMVEDICDVEIIDAYGSDMTPETLGVALKKSNPDIVGITVLMDQFAATGHRVAEIVKSLNPAITVILGGVYATINPEAAISDPHVDYLVLGDGEYVLKEMIGYFKGENPLPMKGICYRSEGEIIDTGRAEPILDLDALPRPAYHLIPFEKYANEAPRKGIIGSPKQFPYVRMLTSRGCPYGCAFCQIEHIVGKRFRAKSAERVLDEIAWLKEEYGIKSLIFEDDNFFLDKKRVTKILEGMIERGLAMPWIAADAAVFRIDADLLRLMRASGCEYIAFALETGTERVLKDIIGGKPIDFDHARKMVAIARDLGIYVVANFIIGFPTETWDEIRQTLAFAEDVQADYVRIFAAIPLRKTRLWDLCLKEKAFKKQYDHFGEHSSWSTGQIETKDFSPNDLTILRAYEWDRINFSSPEKRKRTADMINISEEELLAVRRETLENAIRQISGKNDAH
ncbi:MAG: hypothetical protein CSYNP_01521 [Syntrophus sp. SKADARSKE-3]|nr:hypothetical protein [Syntrophus sp. SKADARSKE-3]